MDSIWIRPRTLLASSVFRQPGLVGVLDTATRRRPVRRLSLPFAAGFHAGMEGSFVILGFPGTADPDVAYIEGRMGDVYVESIEGVHTYNLAWERMSDSALPPATSAELIGTELKGLR